jgi:predicted DNA-binding protein
MSAFAHQETMQRKPILMPPEMISRVDRIAKAKNVSFAKVVRDAVDAFDEEMTKEDESLLEALAETLIERTKAVAAKIDETIKRLDETHALLETQNGRE